MILTVDRQIQKAGDNVTQCQAETINYYSGLDEKRVAEIVSEQCGQAISGCIAESRLLVEQRIGDFKSELISMLSGRPELVSSIKEPSCADSLGRAAVVASKTLKLRDKKMLSELLGKRFSNPTDRHIATGANKAIDIVDLLTDEELDGLTIFYAVESYYPTSASISEGLATLDDLYGKLPIDDLPEGEEWVDNLDIHDALRASALSALKKMADLFFERFDGYTVWGIEEGSLEADEARRAIAEAGMPLEILMDHELHCGYLRLGICNHGQIDDYSYVGEAGLVASSANAEQKVVLEEVLSKSRNEERFEEMKKTFLDKLSEYENIGKVMHWWDNIPLAPRTTVVGKALADANIRRIDPDLPEFDEQW